MANERYRTIIRKSKNEIRRNKNKIKKLNADNKLAKKRIERYKRRLK